MATKSRGMSVPAGQKCIDVFANDSSPVGRLKEGGGAQESRIHGFHKVMLVQVARQEVL
jgi:hypothetical protein